jgi:hypothetical protein
MNESLDKSPLLLVYDMLGRLSLIYTKHKNNKGWERHSVIDEHAGKAVTQFSVRFSFTTLKDRNKFMSLVCDMVDAARAGNSVTKADMNAAVTLLSRTRAAPVLLPVAVAKSSLSSTRI